jgi:N-acetylglucosamine kinase-like BadF-type ATPase
MHQSLILGVDGGGTKTHCVALNPQREIVGEGWSGSSNRHSVGEATARANLAAAIQSALQASGCGAEAVAGVGVGMAGVDRPGERAMVTAWLQASFPGVPTVIENDALVALAGGAGELFGVVVISGTGMIVYGVNRQGQRRRAGGWGALIDAHGSGYAVGLAGLRAIARAADLLDPPTALTAALLQRLELNEPSQIIPWLYGDLSWARVAELAPLVVECAIAGDRTAQRIVDQTTAALAEAVVPVVHSLNLQNAPFPLVLAGGLLQMNLIRTGVVERIHAQVSMAELVESTAPPAVGAALLVLGQQSGE